MTGSATSAEKPRSRAAPERTSKVEPTIDSLAEYVGDARAKGLRVVHCHGVFDVLHPGVIRLLESARRAADRLVVTVVADVALIMNRSGEVPTTAEVQEEVGLYLLVSRVGELILSLAIIGLGVSATDAARAEEKFFLI